MCQKTGKTGFSCNCTTGFVGIKCDMPVSACELAYSDGKPCRNGGICRNDVEGHLQYKCFCTDGWTGGHCEIAANSHENVNFTKKCDPKQKNNFLSCFFLFNQGMAKIHLRHFLLVLRSRSGLSSPLRYSHLDDLPKNEVSEHFC